MILRFMRQKNETAQTKKMMWWPVNTAAQFSQIIEIVITVFKLKIDVSKGSLTYQLFHAKRPLDAWGGGGVGINF